MKLPLEITFQGMPQSVAVKAAAKRHAEKLETFCPDMIRCRVSLVLDEKHRHQGKRFHVQFDVTIPGIELVSSTTNDEDVYVALRDASRDTTRQLKDAIQKRREAARQGTGQ